MANFEGRSGNLLLFTQDDRGVIIDANFGIVVAAGELTALRDTEVWGDGEFTEQDSDLAQQGLSAFNSAVSENTGRLYTVPRGVRVSAKVGLDQMNSLRRGGTELSVHTAGILASGGQISFERLRHLDRFFSRHEDDRLSDRSWNVTKDGKPSSFQITWAQWGGDAAARWAGNILKREADKALTADGVIIADDSAPQADPFQDAFLLDPDSGPEFIARVRLDGSGIDRLYKIDGDGEVFLWDDGAWDDLCILGADIYQIDSELDSAWDDVQKTHVVIDPSSAVILGAKLQGDPFATVSIEDIDATEAQLAAEGMYGIDWGLVDYAMVAALEDPATRAANATSQVRDAKGKFATEGQNVIVGNNPAAGGVITKVDPTNGTVNVQLHSGGSVTVPGKSVSPAQGGTQPVPQLAQDSAGPSGPNSSAEPPTLDVSGILSTPRTPLGAPDGHIPLDLPSMTPGDLHDMLYNWPAWVNDQRAKNMASAADGLPEPETESYKHPLILRWLGKSNANGDRPTPMWKQQSFSVTASTGPFSNKGKLTPETSDIQPIYMAIVSPDDPSAVVQLIALVPASTTIPSPTIYSRADGTWQSSPQTLADLQSATPPPVVPLDSDTLQTVIQQVDASQVKPGHKDNTVPSTDADMDGTPVSQGTSITPAGSGAVTSSAQVLQNVGISTDQALMVLYGTDLRGFQSMVAAGGHGGDAETLRRYWTTGLGAAKIRWGEGGDFYRCVRYLAKYIDNPQGYCQDRHHDAIGIYTSTHAKEIRKAEGKEHG